MSGELRVDCWRRGCHYPILVCFPFCVLYFMYLGRFIFHTYINGCWFSSQVLEIQGVHAWASPALWLCTLSDFFASLFSSLSLLHCIKKNDNIPRSQSILELDTQARVERKNLTWHQCRLSGSGASMYPHAELTFKCRSTLRIGYVLFYFYIYICFYANEISLQCVQSLLPRIKEKQTDRHTHTILYTRPLML